MNSKKIILLAGHLLCLSMVFAQSTASRTILRTGDHVPDYGFTRFASSVNKPIKLSESKNKLLILDLWTTFCSPCVENLPKLDSLQKEFTNRIQIIPVDWELPEERITFFISKIMKKRKYVLPFAMDTVVYSWFMDEDNNWLGQYVWIRDNKVLAITGAGDVNANNINQVLNGKMFISKTQKPIEEKKIPENTSHALLPDRVELPSQIKYTSMVTSYLKGVVPYPYVKFADEKDSTSYIRLLNLNLSYIYQFAYNLNFHSTVIETRDSLLFNASAENGNETNTYCIEIIKPGANKNELLTAMQNELSQAFPYAVDQARRNVNVAVLKRLPTEKLTSSGGTGDYYHSAVYFSMHNRPFSKIRDWLSSRLYSDANPIRFVLDETGINKNVDVELIVSQKMSTNLSEITQELKKIGIELSFENREMDVWVISDSEKAQISKK